MRRRVSFVLYLTVLALLLVAPAQAYIDPASSSLIFQAVIAGLAVGGTAVASFWGRLRSMFQRRGD